MQGVHIDTKTAEHWEYCTKQWRIVSTALAEIELKLLLELGQTDGKAIDAVRSAMDACEGQAYMFSPQHEWIGNKSDGEGMFKIRKPHIAE